MVNLVDEALRGPLFEQPAGFASRDVVVADPAVGTGTFLWDGAAGTWFWVDPTYDIAFVGMIQRRVGPHLPPVQLQAQALVYQALINPGR